MVALVLSCLALVMLSPFWAFMELLDVYSSSLDRHHHPVIRDIRPVETRLRTQGDPM